MLVHMALHAWSSYCTTLHLVASFRVLDGTCVPMCMQSK